MGKILVQRANVVLSVSSDQKEKYLSKGFSVIDEDGTVVEEAMPKDPVQLQGLVRKLQAEIVEKDAKIAELEEKTAKKAKTSKSE